MITGNNELVGYDSMCSTYHSIQNDESSKECRYGDSSNDTKESSLIRNETGMSCYYLSYSGPNPDTPTNKTDYSTCGFNNVTNAYCKKRKGDPWFLKAYDNYKIFNFTTLSCHPSSTINDCKDIVDIKADWKINFEKAILEVDKDYGYPLYASNDVCVAKVVTKNYWQGTHPDLSSSLNICATLMIISAIFISLNTIF